MTYQNLKEDAKNNCLIVAHRGTSGGNIPCNTWDAFDAAILHGADMIELDVAPSRDGELFVFHPGMEFAYLGSQQAIQDLTAEEVHKLRFLNGDRTPTEQPVRTLAETFQHLKGRCYINVDKYWSAIEPITETIRKYQMQDQILVKASPAEETFVLMEKVAPEINFMLILKHEDQYSDALLKRNLNYVGAEVLFTEDSAPVASPSYIQSMQEKGLLVWANSIVYNYKDVLAAGHNDDISIVGKADEGWGWLIKRGYNFIQTDWPLALNLYKASL